MTIKQAIKQVIASDAFKEQARNDAKLRVFLGRYNKGVIGNGAAIDLLLKFGFKIEVIKPS